MAKNVIRDETGVVKKVAQQIVKDTPEFQTIKQLKFIFTWWVGEEPEKDQEKTYITASVRKLPARERDLYNKDVEFRVNKDLWENANAETRYRIVWHELCHVHVHTDEDFNIELDQDGRVSFSLLSHDVVIKTFSVELDKFGLPPDLVYPSSLVSKAYRRHTKKEKV